MFYKTFDHGWGEGKRTKAQNKRDLFITQKGQTKNQAQEYFCLYWDNKSNKQGLSDISHFTSKLPNFMEKGVYPSEDSIMIWFYLVIEKMQALETE